jgi:phytoene dehydrogenase-like protein
MKDIVIVGAGIGGLVTAAVLSRLGYPVTVLEAHVYAGGCAGTFYHQGFRFDAGATLSAGFYPGGPMDQVAKSAGIETAGAFHELGNARAHAGWRGNSLEMDAVSHYQEAFTIQEFLELAERPPVRCRTWQYGCPSHPSRQKCL